jgi:hypothetical protein
MRRNVTGGARTAPAVSSMPAGALELDLPESQHFEMAAESA